MFRRILVENWQTVLTVVSFAIFAAVFLAVLIRTWRAPRDQIDRIARLPLDNDHE